MSDTETRPKGGEETASTRERILAAALDIAGTEGFGALTTRRVAAEAGVNLGLVHYHFGSKSILAAETMETFLGELRRRVAAFGDAVPGGIAEEEEALARLLEGILEAFSRRPGFLADLVGNATAGGRGPSRGKPPPMESVIRGLRKLDLETVNPPLFALYRSLADRVMAVVSRRLGSGRESLVRERSLRLVTSILHPMLLTRLPDALFGIDLGSPAGKAAYVRGAVADALTEKKKAGA